MKIFEPVKIKNHTIKNRVVMAPMNTQLDITTGKARSYYSARAEGGTGIIIIENTSAEYFNDPEYSKKISALAKAIHEKGALAIVQLTLSFKSPVNQELVAPSKNDNAREATLEEIKIYQEQLVNASMACMESGFDGIELHGANGFFISQFFSPLKNNRNDNYGGSLKNRMNFASEPIKLIREKAGVDFLILYRLSAAEYVPGGATLEDSKRFAVELEKAGIDILDVSAGLSIGSEPPSVPGNNYENGLFVELANQLKQVINIPVITVGLIKDSELAESIIQESKADFVALGRSLIADPFWVKKASTGNEKDITKCISCNKCLDEIRKKNPICCTVNKNVGFEK